MKALKYVLYGVLGLLVLAVAAVAIFAATFDPNRHKGRIEAAVKEQTGRTLKLQGDLKVAFFPSLGAEVAGVTLSEKDPGQEFVKLERAHGSVAVMPLLRGEIVVDRIRLSGLTARVVKGKDGRFNFQDLLEGKGETPAPAEKKGEKPEPAGDGAVKFDIAGIQIERSAVSYKDLATGQALELRDVNLETGRIADKADGKLQLSSAVRGTQPAMDLKVRLSGGYQVDLPAGAYALSNVDGTVQGTLEKEALEARLTAPKVDIAADKASGQAVVLRASLKGPQRTTEAELNIAGIEGSAKALAIPKLTANLAMSGKDMPRPLKVPLEGSVNANLEKETLEANLRSKFDESNIQAKLGLAKFSPPSYLFDVNVDRLNVDQYFPPEKAPTEGKPAPAEKPSPKRKEAETPVDLSMLEGLTANGRLAVGSLQARGLKLANVKAEVKAANGRLESPHSASLYDGTVNGTLTAQANANRVTAKEALTGIQIGPLLRDFAQQDRLEGRGNVSLDVAGAGPTVEAIKRSLDGTAKVNLRDGAVKGVDIAGILRKVKSLGGKSEEGAADSKQKTDFSELNATFVIRNGVATNKDLDIKSPLLRVTGAGTIDIGKSSLDYTAKAAVVASTKGQGGKELEQLAGVTVPVRLTGPFESLQYKVDYGAVAADLAKTRVGGKVKEKVEKQREKVEDRVKDRVKGLLNR